MQINPNSPKKGELTHQTLHPEKYLVEKPNLPVPELINPIKKTMTDITEEEESFILPSHDEIPES